jgi:flagellar biosynthetic protein FliQ
LSESDVLNIASGAMLMTAKLALPFLLASLVVGLAVSLFQSVTSIQEVTLTFVPKLGAMALIMVVAGHWMLDSLVGYTQQLFGQAASLVGG